MLENDWSYTVKLRKDVVKMSVILLTRLPLESALFNLKLSEIKAL